jgi:hypothetical protein
MEDNDLLKRVAKLGFDLFETERDENAGKTLADVVKSRDLRLWEGFPVMLLKAQVLGTFPYEEAKKYLGESPEAKWFDELVAMSMVVYKTLGVEFTAAEGLKSKLAGNEEEYKMLEKSFAEETEFKVGEWMMSSQRVKNTFKNYHNKLENENHDFRNLLDSKYLELKNEFDLEFALAQVLSPKQRDLFLKRLKGEKMTKTEREYFYRVVKRKVAALANSELYRLAREMMGK